MKLRNDDFATEIIESLKASDNAALILYRECDLGDLISGLNARRLASDESYWDTAVEWFCREIGVSYIAVVI